MTFCLVALEEQTVFDGLCGVSGTAQIKHVALSGACAVSFGMYVLCFFLRDAVFVFMQLLWLVVIQIEQIVRLMVMVGQSLCLCSEASHASHLCVCVFF